MGPGSTRSHYQHKTRRVFRPHGARESIAIQPRTAPVPNSEAAPSALEFHAETVRKLDTLQMFDCLRDNKSMMSWDVEPRVRFLDREFLDIAMGMDATAKMAGTGRIEKAVLREAFRGYLPSGRAVADVHRASAR